MKFKGTVGKTTNIFALSPGIYSLGGAHNDYMPGDISPYGNLSIVPGTYNYVTAVYIDSSSNTFFGFCDKSNAYWRWNQLPYGTLSSCIRKNDTLHGIDFNQIALVKENDLAPYALHFYKDSNWITGFNFSDK